MQLGDDYGDNTCTFHCQLPLNHEGPHGELGQQGRITYSIYWSETPAAAQEMLIVEDDKA